MRLFDGQASQVVSIWPLVPYCVRGVAVLSTELAMYRTDSGKQTHTINLTSQDIEQADIISRVCFFMLFQGKQNKKEPTQYNS